MSAIPETRSALLAEALKFLASARSTFTQSSLPDLTIDVAATRLELHDELFRYFLAVNQYIGQRRNGKKASLADAPRLTIDACTSASVAKGFNANVRGAPPISRICAFGNLLDRSAKL